MEHFQSHYKVLKIIYLNLEKKGFKTKNVVNSKTPFR